MKIYTPTLSGDQYDEFTALDWARGYAFEEEATEQPKPKHCRKIDSFDEVSIWYDYGADYYFFADN